MKKLCFLLLTFAAVTLWAFDFSRWKAANFTSCSFENGVLHLTKSVRSENNAYCYRKISGASLKPFHGRQVTLSADVELLNSSHADTVGVSLACKLKDGRILSGRAALPYKEKSAKTKIFTVLNVPADAVYLTAQIEAPRGWYRTAETLWSNIKLETSFPSSEKWNCGTGNFLSIDRKPLFWKWKSSAGLNAALKKGEFHLDGKGELTLRCQDGFPCGLGGTTTHLGKLILEVTEATPFSIEITSFGKKNIKVDVPEIPASKAGLRQVKIPLSRFAPFHDLVRFEEITFQVNGTQTIRKCVIADLDMARNSKNIIFDPSFELSETPGGAYMMWGDYRPEKSMAKVCFDTASKFHGKRSLKISPGGFITLYAADQKGVGAVFSLYARGGGKFGCSIQRQEGSMHGTTGMPLRKKEFLTSDAWSRYELVIPGKGKHDKDQNLFEVVVTNTGKQELYIDAVQLEQNVEQATAFKPERDTVFRSRLSVELPMDLRPEPADIPENRHEGKVQLSVINLHKRGYKSVPVRGAVPFASGVLFDHTCVRLVDSSGKSVPAQFSVLARRTRDKSIVSLAVDFNTALTAGKTERYTLVYGKKKTPATGRNIAVVKGSEIHIDTGKLRLVLTPGSASFLKNADAFCGVTTSDGKLYRGSAEIMRIEENGPQRATVFLRGSSLLAWELRLTFFKDQNFAAVDYSFENNFTAGDPLFRNIRSIFIQLPWSREFKIDSFSGKENTLFVQRHARSGKFEWDVFISDGRKGKVENNLKLSGTASGRNHAVSIYEFAELAPRAVGFHDGNIRIFHYPPAGTLSFDVLAGLSGTVQFNYSPAAASVPDYFPALICADPEYVAKTGVFGDFITDKAVAGYFPRSGKILAGIADALENSSELSAFYGLGDYGECGSRNFYSNHETALVRNMWISFLASGRAEAFKLASAHAIHQRDVDQVHFRYGSTGVHTHNPYSNYNFNFHTGHFWLTGVVYHYLITGDRRSFESAISAMAVPVQKSNLRYKGGRERHRMLFHLAEMYELTGINVLKEAFERQYNIGGASDPDTYYGALAYEALEKLYAATGEKKYLERMTEEVKLFYRKNRVDVADMPENRIKKPTYHGSSDEGRGVMALYSGSQAARRFRNTELINFLCPGKNNDPVMSAILNPLSQDGCLNWTRSAFSVMRDAGIKENPAMPDSYSFITRLTGRQKTFNNYTPFCFEIVPGTDGKAVLDIYRYRKFRYWQSGTTDDFVECKLYSSAGKLLKNVKLYANLPNEHRRIESLSPDGKNIRAEVAFVNDCWGSVSSPNRIRLSANRKYGARNRIHVPIAFYIKAPLTGSLEINWKWQNSDNVHAGVILGAMLKDDAGKTVAGSSYTIPSVNGETYTTKLDIPSAYRGKVLKLYITDFKWVSWKIDGLDYPWLGNTEKDLQ